MSYLGLRRTCITLLVLAMAGSALPAAAEFDFYTVTPCRVLDSRGNGGPLSQGTTYDVDVAGTCTVPAGAEAVSLNVTVVGATGSGELAVFPTGTIPPFVGTLPFRAGRTQAILQLVGLSASGKMSFHASIPSGPGMYQIVIDVSGYFLNNTVVADDQTTVAEDAAATAIDVLANDTDPDETLLIASVTDPANGTVVLTGGSPGAHTGLTYQPDADYCNDPPGTALDTFSYTVNTGSTATVEVTVTCVDDAPVAVDDATTVAEDAAATVVDVLGNDTDVDGGAIGITSVTQPANGTVVITNGGADLTYQPDASYCNDGSPTDDFTYTLTPGGDTATVAVTVTCSDDLPAAVDDAATVAEDSSNNAIDVLANDTDTDGGTKSVSSVTQPANGVVVITGGGTGVSYTPNANYCNNPPGTTPDTFTYTLNGGSIGTVSVTVTCSDDNPTAVNDTATVNEDSSNTAIDVLANDTDPDGGAKSVTSVTQPANGAVAITGGGTGVSYTPNANYCNSVSGTPDTFTYTLTPGGSVATVSVTVTCSDDNPAAVNDSATVVEDSSNNAINVLANDTDPDGGAISITSVTQPANGAVAITGGGTGVSYTPNASYCNSVSGTPDTFTYTLTPGGSVATVSVTVNCADDPPAAVNDTAAVNEDSGANTINVLANDVDIDGGAISITSVTQPANGAVVITGGGTGLTYAPNANYCNNPPGTTPDTFTYTLSPGGSTATVSVTVNCLNDGPVIDLDANDDKGTAGSDFAVTFTEGDAAKLIEDPLDATLTDIDSATLASLTVTLTNLLDAGAEALDADLTGFPGISKSYDTTTDPLKGVLTLTGPDTLANFQAVLRKVTYHNSETAPDTTARMIEFVANDGSADSVAATSTVTVVAVDSNPVAVDDGTTVAEDASATAVDVLANDTDPDGGPMSITSVTQPANGAVAITGGGTGVSYTPNANYCNSVSGTPDTFTYTLTPGGSVATVSVTVTCSDDNPTAVNDAATVNEDSGATAIDVLANDTDPDGGAKSVTSVTQPANGAVAITGGGTGVSYTPNANYCNSVSGTPDTFTYTLTPGGSVATVSVTVTCVDDNPAAVNDSATVVEDSSNNAINVLANDTDPDGGAKSVTSVTQPANGAVAITGGGTGVSYTPNANYCNSISGTPDTFTYTLTPGGSVATVSVTVTCVDDPPVAVNDAATVDEDSGANAIPVLANDTDIDGGAISITSVTQPANGVVVITGGGTGLTYAPNANYCNNPPGTTPNTFTYTLTPGGSVATVTMTVTCINDPPVADADLFDYLGNTELRVDTGAVATPHALETTPTTFGVIDGDSDPVEGNAISVSAITFGGCTDLSAPFDCTDPAVGTLHMETDGKFFFRPAPGDTGAAPAGCGAGAIDKETFQYTLTDNGTPSPASTTGTVTLCRYARVWYVDPNAGAGNGTSATPLNSLTALNGAGGAGDSDAAGDYIFIHDGTLAGSIELEGNQRLIGEGVGLSIPVNLNANGSPTDLVPAGAKPQLTNASGDTVKVTQAIPVEIVGLSLAGGTTAGGGSCGSPTFACNAIDLTSAAALTGSATLTIANIEFRGAGAEGMDVNLNAGTTGTVTLNVTNNSWAPAGTHTGNAVDVNRVAGTLNLNFSSNTGLKSNNVAGSAVLINGGAVASTTITGFSGNSVSGDTLGAGVVISNVTFNSVDGDNLAIGASGKPVGGAGMSLATVQGSLSFDDLDIYASTSGLTVNGTGSMAFSVTPAAPAGSGTSVILANGGAAVDVSNATLNLQLDDMDSTTTGAGVNLSTVSGTFSTDSDASISKTSGGGTAFSVASSNATVNYGGTLNVTSGAGVSLSNNTGSTISFSGTLTLNTGGNLAFAATGGGTVTATSTTSTLTTTTGTPLTVTNTNIGSGGLRFQSITSNGANNGILLSGTTGSTGRLVVGPAVGGPCNSVATCAGGAIQNSSGAAISLTNTRNVSFTEMYILNGGTHGVSGTGMTDVSGGANPTFELKNSFLDSPGDSDNESALYFDTAAAANITGRLVVSNTTIQNFEDVGIHVGNNSGTLTIDVTNVTINNNSDTNGEEGIDVAAEGTASITLNVSGASTFTDLEGGGFNVITQNSGVVDINISGTTITGTGGPDNFPTPPAMTFSAEGSSSTMTFDITNNDILDSSGDGIFIGHEGTIMGRLTGNNVSGMATGDGLRIDTDTTGSNTVTILIDGNNFGNVAGFTGIGDDGIQVLHRDGTKVLNLTITNNQIGNTASEGIRYFADDDVSGGGPGNVLRISGNTFTNVGDPNTIVVIAQDPGTDVCANITGNTLTGAGVPGITLQQSLSAVLQITQASTAALSAANEGATVTPTGTITFNGTCITPPQPTNP